MDEAQVVECVALVAHDQPTEIAQPGDEALHLPAAAKAAQRTTLLRLGACAAPSVGRDHLHAQLPQGGIEWVGIVGAVADQAARQVGYETGVEGGRDEGALMRRSRGGTCGERKTKAVCHCQELRTFAPLGRSHTAPPFLATRNVPRVKHSERSSLPRSLRSRASASSTRSSVPSRTQRWKRRWQVWYGGYRSGRSAHCAPVRRIQRIPFNTSRLLRHGRPRPSARRGSASSWGSSAVHCSSVRSMTAASSCRRTAYHPFMRPVVASALAAKQRPVPPDTTSTAPSVTLSAVSSSIAYAGTGIPVAHRSRVARDCSGNHS